MPESQQLFFGLQLVSRIFQHTAIQTKIVLPFGGFFQQNKSAPANRKIWFYTNRDPNKQEVGFFLFEVFQIFKTEIKKSKTNSSG
jgi:hypothetical protein